MVSLEVFTNQPVGTVTSGGTTTSDTAFTVTPTNPFPAASTSVTPNTFFRIVDQADTSEIMIVTVAPGGSSSGQSWTVTRGAEGTTPVVHSANWTAVQLLSAGTFQNLKQTPSAATSAITVANTTNETVVASYQPVSGEIVAGTSYEAIAYGGFGKVLGGALPTLQWAVYWGGSGAPGSTFTSTGSTQIAKLTTGTNAPAFLTTVISSGMTFDLNGTITFIDATHAQANLNWWYNNATSLATAASNAVTSSTTSGGVVVSGSGPLILTAKWSATGAANTLTAVAPLIYRAA